MKVSARVPKQSAKRSLVAVFLLVVWLATSTAASADETDARRLLKPMSDYLAGQNALSFNYDSSLEVVTTESQLCRGGAPHGATLRSFLLAPARVQRSHAFV